MTDLFKKTRKSTVLKNKQSEDPSKRQQVALSSSNDVKNFLNKVATMPKAGAGDARLVFALDATASRQPTWDMASRLQAEMFQTAGSLGGLSVQLSYFRGFAEFFASNWQTSSEALLSRMSRISCQAGATQIQRLLRHVLAENEKGQVKCVVYIGDAMEENIDLLAQLSGKLGLLNIPLFMFQEGHDPVARNAFIEMTRLSRGAYSQFDASSIDQLKELLRAVAVYAAGGLKALEQYSQSASSEVRLLEQQLKS